PSFYHGSSQPVLYVEFLFARGCKLQKGKLLAPLDLDNPLRTTLSMGDERRLEGTVVYSIEGRLHYGFDVFTLHLPPLFSAHSHPEFLNHARITDGKSINYNAQFVAPSDAKLLLHGTPRPQNPELGEEEMVVYVSERSGNARLHFSSRDGPVLGPLNAAVKDADLHTPFFFDRPVVRNGTVYFVSIQEHANKPLKSWCAVYGACLRNGRTIRLTPRGVVDYSPAVSPSGKWIA
ncbi:hypothetical protein KI387_003049, partial [Taxus chinensis]